MSRSAGFGPPGPVRVVYVAVLAMWVLVLPLAVQGNVAQDAVPFLVAGELSTSDPGAVYSASGDLYAMAPAFAERSCAISPPGTDCATVNVGFVSPPPAVLVGRVAAALGPDLGALAFRVLAAACLAAGMAVLWARLASLAPEAPACLLATALLATPFATAPIALGQNSPLLFLSAALGLVWATRWPRALAVAAVLAATVVFKLFPLALLAVLVWRRRWAVAAWTAGLVVAITVVTVPVVDRGLWSAFVDASAALGPTTPANTYNGSLVALAHLVAPATTGGSGIGVIVVGAVLAVGLLVLAARRRADDDALWSLAWLVLLLVVPMVWWHYLWVGLAAVAYAWRAGGAVGRRLVALPVLAAASLLISIVTAGGTTVPWAQALFLVASVAVALWLLLAAPARRPTEVAAG